MSTVITREQGYSGFSPEMIRIVTTSTLAQVTTAGWYNNSPIQGESLSPVDVVLICYSYATTLQQTKQFNVAISASGIVTLSLAESSVILPVVSGDFPIFSGTAGAIADSGLAPSSVSGQAYVVTTPGGLTSGNIPFLNDTHGTLNTGRAPSAATAGYKVVMSPGSLTIGNLLQSADANGTLADAGITASGLQVLSASITLNQAAVLAAYATPFQIVAASANKVIVPVKATIYTNFQTAAFTAGGVAILQYDSTAHGAGTNALAATIPAAEITAASSQIYTLDGVVATALTGITNKGLFFSNQTQAFTGGNAASTVVVTVSYYLVTATV